ncbi:MAG: proteasome-activating nucleotidase [Candidatus Woesearchaeota archaeon]
MPTKNDKKTGNIAQNAAQSLNQGGNHDFVFPYSVDLEEENRILRETVSQLKNEVDKFKAPALLISDVIDVLGEKAIIRLPNGNSFLVEISTSVKKLKPGDSVVVEQKNLTIIDKIDSSKNFNVEKFIIIEKPDTQWESVGGLQKQVQEIKEVVELPLKHPELFKKIGIQPPKGILLHGPPGTGKTLLAKAVAHSSNSTFIELVGSELVQKFIGEGARLVKEVFQLAREKAPSIVFIDEIDAIASRRIDIGTSGEREVQRTFMQFLAELDGFKPLDNVKIIGCTNRKDLLDPAILRPGRLDRLIEAPNPDNEGVREIFKIHTKNMAIDKEVKTDALVSSMKGFSGAQIRAVCTEAGYFAIRAARTSVAEQDFVKAVEKIKQPEQENDDYLKAIG